MVLAEKDSNLAVLERVTRSSSHTDANGFCKLTFTAMSTTCRVHFRIMNPSHAAQFRTEILRWVAWFESRYSRFIEDSLIGQINNAAGEHWVDVDPESDALFNLCNEMVFFTRGVFDPTALPLLRLWNWKQSPATLPDEKAIAAARELVGWRKVQRRKGAIFLPRAGMCLDLGGIGKEYAVDRVVTMALEHGINDVLVDFGQDVRVHGQSPERGAWHIGLEDARNPGRCWTGVAVNDHAVATSGDYIRRFVINGRRYGHIIDPRNGQPVDNGALAVSVIAPNCTFAGILSTAAFILGPKEGIDLMSVCPGVEGCVVTASNEYQTRGIYAYRTS